MKKRLFLALIFALAGAPAFGNDDYDDEPSCLEQFFWGFFCGASVCNAVNECVDEDAYLAETDPGGVCFLGCCVGLPLCPLYVGSCFCCYPCRPESCRCENYKRSQRGGCGSQRQGSGEKTVSPRYPAPSHFAPMPQPAYQPTYPQPNLAHYAGAAAVLQPSVAGSSTY